LKKIKDAIGKHDTKTRCPQTCFINEISITKHVAFQKALIFFFHKFQPKTIISCPYETDFSQNRCPAFIYTGEYLRP
jgi:hypothetical protein